MGGPGALNSLLPSCRKALGHPHEQWTTQLLADHVRREGPLAGFPSLERAGKSLAHDLLRSSNCVPTACGMTSSDATRTLSRSRP